MSNRRPLTPTEEAAAARFDAALDRSSFTAESLASTLGLTPPAVNQWRRAEIVIPLRRAARVASLLSVDPAEICVEWAVHVSPYLNATASQSVGIDAIKLATSIGALRAVAERGGLEYAPETHMEETLAVYQIACAMPSPASQTQIIDFGAAVAEILRKRREGSEDGRQRVDEQAGRGHRGRPQAKS